MVVIACYAKRTSFCNNSTSLYNLLHVAVQGREPTIVQFLLRTLPQVCDINIYLFFLSYKQQDRPLVSIISASDDFNFIIDWLPFQVIVFERGDLVFVFNFHPENTYEGYIYFDLELFKNSLVATCFLTLICYNLGIRSGVTCQENIELL